MIQLIPVSIMRISDNLYRFRDCCNVYVLTHGTDAVLVDFGTGDVLDHLAEFGVDRVTDVLMTHHHRDQAQGLPRAAAEGIRIWVPPIEEDLFAHVDEHWQQRGISNYYNLRQDRFSLIRSVPVTGTVREYRTMPVGPFQVRTIPTPGHTTGSVSYFIEVDGHLVAFVGDLIYGPGKVWSLAATQWTYTHSGGLASNVISLHEMLDEKPDLALPSHGEPIHDVPAAVAATEPDMRALLDINRPIPWDLDAWRNRPFERLTDHLLRNRTANAQSFVLISESGGALLIDFGYDMDTGWPAGEDKAARRPWLPSLRALKRDFGVQRVEVAIPTHYHDDHVAGFNLLRGVEGTEIWSEAGIAEIMADPERYDLPCLYHDAVATDRVLPLEEPFTWREYEITLYPLPGHCANQVAVSVQVDGIHALATGDQQESQWIPGHKPEVLNYQYKNGFRPEDYVSAARLYRKLRPDLILTGHWGVRWVEDAWLDEMLRQSEKLLELHRALLARDDVDFGPGDFSSTIQPYVTQSRAGASIDYQVKVINPLHEPGSCTVTLAMPPGWTAEPPVQHIDLAPGELGTVPFVVRSPHDAGWLRRAVLAADLTVNGRRFGQRAECFVDLR
jgi:glyoxylase-like metal-dependent hydrolase (beta-lactamase superfamily II)